MQQHVGPEHLREHDAQLEDVVAELGGRLDRLRADADHDIAGVHRAPLHPELLRPERDPPVGHAAAQQVHRRRPDEAGHEHVDRMLVQALWRVDLLEPPVAHHRDAVAHRHRLGLIVGDVQRRRPQLLVQPRDVRPHLDAQLGVEIAQGLVHQERLGRAHDRPPQRNPLALTATQGARPPSEQLADPQPRRDPPHALADRRLLDPLHLEREAHVLIDRHVRVQRVGLEHHRDVAVLRGDVVDDPRADRDRARRRVLEPRDHPQRRRLAGARRPDQDRELAVGDLEVQPVHGARAVREHLRDAVERDLRHQPRTPAM